MFPPGDKEHDSFVTFFFSSGDEEHDAAVGRDAHLRRLHRHGADHGLGQQGHRDKERRDGASGRGVYAQEGAETQVPVRAQ